MLDNPRDISLNCSLKLSGSSVHSANIAAVSLRLDKVFSQSSDAIGMHFHEFCAVHLTPTFL